MMKSVCCVKLKTLHQNEVTLPFIAVFKPIFGQRIIFKNVETNWSSRSLDLRIPDNLFWGCSVSIKSRINEQLKHNI